MASPTRRSPNASTSLPTPSRATFTTFWRSLPCTLASRSPRTRTKPVGRRPTHLPPHADRLACTQIELLACSCDVHLAEALYRLALAEVVQLEQLAHLDLPFLPVQGRVGEAPRPLHRLFLGLYLDERVASDQLLRLGEGPVDHGALFPGVRDTPALRARLQPGGVEQHAGLLQLLVVLRHLGEDLLVRHDARFRVLRGLHDDHESHRRVSFQRSG